MQNLGGRCPLPPVVGWQLGSPFSKRGAGGATGVFLGRNGIATGNPRLRFPAIPFLPGSRSGLRANAQGHRGLRVLYSSQVSARCGTRGRRRVAFGGGGARAGTENTMPVFLGSRLDTCASTQGFSRLIYCFRLPGGLGRRTQLGAPRCTVFLRSPVRVPDLRPAMHSIHLPHLYFLCTNFQDHYLC